MARGLPILRVRAAMVDAIGGCDVVGGLSSEDRSLNYRAKKKKLEAC